MMTAEHEMKQFNVFICYTHEDKHLCDELYMHLKAFQRTQRIAVWADREIQSGEDWVRQVDSVLDEAQIILLLISSDFESWNVQLSFLIKKMQHAKQDGAMIIPILLRAVDWRGSPLAQFNILPRNHIPVLHWLDRDEAWCSVVKDIRVIVKNRLLDHWKEEADLLYRRQQYQDAFVAYNRILHLEPGNLAASICKGNVCLELQRYEEALKSYEQARKHLSDFEKLQAVDTEAASDEQVYGEALIICRQLLLQNPFPTVLTDVTLEKMLEDPPESVFHEAAIAYLTKAIEHNPVNPFLYHIKGNIYFGLRRYEEALGAYEQAIRLKQNFDLAYSRLSEVIKHINQQEYWKLDLLVRQTLQEVHSIRDSELG